MDRCCGHQEAFGEKTAKRDLRRYRRKGPRKTTRQLLDALRERGLDHASVLDIGGGVGVIEHELLDRGASRAQAVDASRAYLRAAREEAERRGHADRLEQHAGDFVELADTVEPADVVTLDRVICCYPEVDALVSLSAAHARRAYGVVYPRDTRGGARRSSGSSTSRCGCAPAATSRRTCTPPPAWRSWCARAACERVVPETQRRLAGGRLRPRRGLASAAMARLELGDPLAHRALQALVRAEATVRRSLAADLEREGLSAAGFAALVVLTTAGGTLELRTLRRRLGWSKASATEVTFTLEHRGLLRRRRPPTDRRTVLLELTGEGAEIVERVFPGHARRVETAFAPLDEGEKRSLAEICRKLAA